MSKEISMEKIKNSTNLIGLIVFIISIFLILSTVLSLIFVLLRSMNVFGILPEEIALFFAENTHPVIQYTIYSICSTLVLVFLLVISNRVRKDDFSNLRRTSSDILSIALIFILDYLIDLFFNAIPVSTYTDGELVEISTTFSIPIFQIIIIIVLLKNFKDIKKLHAV